MPIKKAAWDAAKKVSRRIARKAKLRPDDLIETHPMKRKRHAVWVGGLTEADAVTVATLLKQLREARKI